MGRPAECAITRPDGARVAPDGPLLRSSPALLIVGPAIACAALVASRAIAAPAPSRLSFAREVGAERCPDESALRAEVAARLGADPFVAVADREVVARIDRQGGRLHGLVELRTSGRVQGSRDLAIDSEDCAELVRAMALALAIALDPEHADTSATPPPATPSPAPLPVTPPPAAPAPRPTAAPSRPPEPPGPRVVPEVGASVAIATGLAPSTAIGFGAFVGVRRGAFSLAAEGRRDLPATGDGVRAALLAGSLVPCARFRWMLGCAVGSVGRMEAEGRTEGRATWAAAGIRVGAELPLDARWFVRAHADALATLRRIELRLDGASVWTTPPLVGSAAVALGLRFP